MVDISKIQKGGIVITKALSIANESQKTKLILEIVKNIDKLIIDSFGNFIIQTVILYQIEDINNKIYKHVLTNIVPLSKDKFASHVIDKVTLLIY